MLLWFTAYILIPAYTILFVQGNNWFTTNFSVIGNVIGREGEFVLWGLIVGIYFFLVSADYCLQNAGTSPMCLADSTFLNSSYLCTYHALSASKNAFKIRAAYCVLFYLCTMPAGLSRADRVDPL